MGQKRIPFNWPTDLVLRVDGHLEGVGAEGELGDVDPLAVDVVVVDVLAAGRDALVAVVLAVVFGLHPRAVVVLQAKAEIVSTMSNANEEIEEQLIWSASS